MESRRQSDGSLLSTANLWLLAMPEARNWAELVEALQLPPNTPRAEVHSILAAMYEELIRASDEQGGASGCDTPYL